MKKTRKIRNLDTLEREIYRLQLEAKNLEGKLESNLERLQQNYFSMFMNSFFCRSKNKTSEKGGIFDSFMKNEKVHEFVNRLTGHVADRAAETIDGLIDKLFRKRTQHSSE